MFTDLMRAIKQKGEQSGPAALLNGGFGGRPGTKDIFSDSESVKCLFMQNTKELKEESYLGLEKVLQKYEADIRNHIRIEQQLKIYSDSIQETLEEKERLFATQLKTKDQEIRGLEKQVEDLKDKLYSIQAENDILREPAKGLMPNPSKKSKKLRTSSSFRENKMSNSVESIVMPKKRRIEKVAAVNTEKSTHNRSKLSSSVDRRGRASSAAKTENNFTGYDHMGGTTDNGLNHSFEKRGTKGFDKSLMVNFKEFLKMQKSRDNMNPNNFSNIFRVKKPTGSFLGYQTTEGSSVGTSNGGTLNGVNKRLKLGVNGNKSHRTNESLLPTASAQHTGEKRVITPSSRSLSKFSNLLDPEPTRNPRKSKKDANTATE